jgi:excinuclease ABC subunit A
MPWKVLGRKWHMLRKGFPSGKRVAWEPDVIEKLFNVLDDALPAREVDYANKQVVYYRRKGESEVWAAVHTKRRGGIDLLLFAEAGKYALGRIADFGRDREIEQHRNGREAVKIRFTQTKQVNAPAFKDFLREHARGQTRRSDDE